jgi:uncharacterized protein DUF4154
MIYSFASFVDWPTRNGESPQSLFVVGVVCEDPFGTILEGTLQGKDFQSRKIQIRRFSAFGDLPACHILFVSQSEKAHAGDCRRGWRRWGLNHRRYGRFRAIGRNHWIQERGKQGSI